MGHQSSSSETPSLENMSKGFDKKGEAIMGSYSAWLTKHPSAMDAFEGMMKSTEGKRLVVFLDYDGTLSPIVNDPDQAFMSEKMRSAVQEVANVFPTAIVSGRSLEKVKAFVQIQNLTYAGSHGMDILTPTSSLKCDQKHQNKAVDEEGKDVIYFQPAKEFLPKIQEISKVLELKIKNIEGASVEDNKFCLSVHFRKVNIEDVDILKEMVDLIVEGYPDFRITKGKKVMEIRPRLDWGKGRALQYLIEYLGFNDSNDFLPLYIGDDTTDEDAFEVIKDMGRGYPIIVSSLPEETNALYSLHDTDEVMSLLKKLAEWKNSTSGSSN